MIKKIILLLIIVLGFESQAQVGINTTTPKAQLEIKSTNEATPANTDGLIIPKINAFPVTNPTVDQQGMLVYLTTTVGVNTPGFYYWNNPTTVWLPVKGSDGGTLDQAYDFGGAGNGRTITADAGAVTIAGTDGLVSTGTSGSGAIAPSGAGTRMVWNPRKAAFRAGNIPGTEWDDANIGTNSVAFGSQNRANGYASTAFGEGNIATATASTAFGFTTQASGIYSTAFGRATIASGQNSVAMGNGTTASGVSSTAFGNGTTASGNFSTALGGGSTTSSGLYSTAIGRNSVANGLYSTAIGNITTSNGSSSFSIGDSNFASSYGETVIGIGATTYTPSTNGATQFRTGNDTDRLFVIGNAIDANNNGSVDLSERSNAMVVLKNGNVGVGISTPQNRLHFHNPTGFQTFIQLTNESTGITATDGMILGNIVGTSEAGIVNYESTNLYIGTAGDSNQVVLTPTGNLGIGTDSAQDKLHVEGSIRMVDGNQGAGKVLISDANGKAIWTTPGAGTAGTLDQSYDFGGAGAGRTITADSGAVTIAGADGLVSTGTLTFGASAPSGNGVRMVWNPRQAAFRAGSVNGTQWDHSNLGMNSVAFGSNSTANGFGAAAFGSGNVASGSFSSAFGTNSTASGSNASVFGISNTASGFGSFAQGTDLNSIGNISTAMGSYNSALSYGETVIGIGATIYTPSTNGDALFRTANATDRLFVIGNAIDSNNNSVVEDIERSNAMVVLKNGNVGLGVSAPGERLQVAGRALFTNGFSADNAALIYRNDTDYMFLGPQSGSSADGGAMALFGSTNVSGGNAGGIDLNVPNAQVRMSHTNGSYAFRANSTSGYAATFELNDIGLEIGHNSTGRALIFSPNSAERMRITPTGNVGIGTTPARKLHVSNGVSGGTSNVNTGILLESSGNVYQHYLAPSTNESGMLFGSELTSINGGIIFNNSIATNGIQFRAGGNANRMTITSAGDVGIGTTAPGGQFELSLNEGRKPTSNTWTIPSDARLKNVDGIYQKGLTEILQLKPIRYHYKNTDKKSFESEVLEKEAYGFLAQEVQQIFPEAVGNDADGYLNFDLHPILVAYTNAFKELDLKNQAAENKNRELELKLQSQEQIINNLIERLEKLEAKN